MKLSLLSCTLLAASASAKTTLFLSSSSTSSSQAAPISIDAAEANEILSDHLDVTYNGARSGRSQIWDHVLKLDAANEALAFDQKASVERLFDGSIDSSKNRLFVLMHGADADAVPSSIGATHEMVTSPSSESFDALLSSYFGDLQNTLRLNDGALNHFSANFLQGLGSLATGVEHAIGGAASWLMSSSVEATAQRASHWWSDLQNLVKDRKSAAFDAVQAELEAVHGLLDRIRSDGQTEDDLAFQPLRIQGLGDVEAAYGAGSIEYAKAKKVVQQALEELADAFRSRSQAQGRDASIALILNDNEARLGKRSAVPSGSLLEPFLRRASPSGLAGSSKKKKPVNLIASCFTDQKELEKASNSCSGHGKARQTSKGGRKCWRCQCQATKEKGRTTYWAGAACEKKDVSTEFVLLGTTGLVLVLISLGSVYYLYAAGNAELPGTLAGVTINLK
ncbi:uncharacterized protein PFL1_03116 [Pseudozyma flocculosa PF-1]|uniref:Vacuolar sorting protein Vps3844 C-terminal domain-containing protein n=2 Tax=Pseudozyma flocculosa TaxID=84751 RepID=A0A5C3F343_9BASI|nr:uncharacterized protein PFL1_03116 [Pseudozyma flocculosa PF-1]EPQ29361.1 hypothetical protein PFL1_03116 [Pseudozyma flocculosa PF-1]SPO37879.1 uncharacterized protein PSFLO_03356 [Pseudozyma flocculosa]